jgi:hypothetical protein
MPPAQPRLIAQHGSVPCAARPLIGSFRQPTLLRLPVEAIGRQEIGARRSKREVGERMPERQLHLIGSVPPGIATEAEGAMRWILRNVDHRRLTAVPSGETRDPNWVVTIFDGLDRDPNLRTIKRNRFIQRGYLGAPLYMVRRGREFRPQLPYAARAGVEYAVFQRLSAELQLADTLPQYGIPHPLDLASFAFWLAAPRHLDALIDATQQQVLAIHHLTGGRVQYQIETPVSLILATATVGQKIVIAWLARLTQRLLATMPPGARVVVHLCAGDLGHKAMIPIFTLG